MNYEPFSSTPQEEQWREIRDFPGYFVSDLGQFMNQATGGLLSKVIKPNGLVFVGLMKNCVQYKRSVPLLVAEAFVSQPSTYTEAFNTPINLDGDRRNNRASNLAWRPLWFARRYHRQFLDTRTDFDTAIEDAETGEIYESTWNAATIHGLIESEIRIAMHNNTYVWPTGQIFREAIGR